MNANTEKQSKGSKKSQTSKSKPQSLQNKMKDLTGKMFQRQGDILIQIISRMTLNPTSNKKYDKLCQTMRIHFLTLVYQCFRQKEEAKFIMDTNEQKAFQQIKLFRQSQSIECQIDRTIKVRNCRMFIQSIEDNINQYRASQRQKYQLWFLKDILQSGDYVNKDEKGYIVCEFKKNFWQDNQQNNDQEKFAKNIYQLCRQVYFVFYQYCIQNHAVQHAKLKFVKNFTKTNLQEKQYDSVQLKRPQIHFILFINSDCQKEEFRTKFKQYPNIFQMLSKFFQYFGISLHVVGSIDCTSKDIRMLKSQMRARDEKMRAREEQMRAREEQMRKQMREQMLEQMRAREEQMRAREKQMRAREEQMREQMRARDEKMRAREEQMREQMREREEQMRKQMREQMQEQLQMLIKQFQTKGENPREQ